MSGSTHGPDTHLWDLLFQEAGLRPHLLTRSAGWLMLTFISTCTAERFQGALLVFVVNSNHQKHLHSWLIGVLDTFIEACGGIYE